MEKKNKYSVLMSVYKNDDPYFLHEALKSIYDDQTVKPDEIVVVFDGPLNTELENVLHKFRENKEAFVKYIPQDKNQGLGTALKIGTSFCTGDYIFRMDSDDISNPSRFEKQICYIEKHPEIDVLGSNIAEFIVAPTENMRVKKCPQNHNDIVRMSRHRNPMNHMTVCIKKSALIEAGGYRPLLFVEDYYLWLNMLASGCIFSNLNDVLVYVRVGNGFESRRGAIEQIHGWKVIQNFMLDNKMITQKDALINMVCINIFVRTPSWIKRILYSKVLRTK